MKNSLLKMAPMATAAAISLMSIAAPAQAGFYFEGLQPHVDAPNCNDAYATECGRYGQVPHEEGASDSKEQLKQSVKKDNKVKIRHQTREGLEK